MGDDSGFEVDSGLGSFLLATVVLYVSRWLVLRIGRTSLHTRYAARARPRQPAGRGAWARRRRARDAPDGGVVSRKSTKTTTVRLRVFTQF